MKRAQTRTSASERGLETVTVFRVRHNAPIHPAATGERNHWQDARSPLGCNGMVIGMLSFTAHEHEGEWVIRVHHANGYAGLGVAVGKEEADLIVRSLNLVCSDWASSADQIKKAWEEFVR